jgi:hypothetical protein
MDLGSFVNTKHKQDCKREREREEARREEEEDRSIWVSFRGESLEPLTAFKSS